MDRLRLAMETAALWAQLEYLIPAEHQPTAEPRLPSFLPPRQQRRNSMTKLKPLLIGLVGAGVLAASGYGLYTVGMQRGMGMAASVRLVSRRANADQHRARCSSSKHCRRRRRHTPPHQTGIKAGDVDPDTGRKVLYYHDPMVPGNKFDRPGKSPFMDMMMVPVYADGDAGSDGSKVTVSPRIQQNLGVRTAEVTEGTAVTTSLCRGQHRFQ
jgi:Cu(I)/Ag(I) efflux system membrane fusion protein